MDEDLPKRPTSYILGGDLDRHSIDDLQVLATELERELARVRQAIASRQDVRSRAEALFKAAASANPVVGSGREGEDD